MTQFPPDPQSTATPATLAPQFELQPVRGWPKVVGIFSIVIGSLGLICNGCGTGRNALNMISGTSQMTGPNGKTIDLPDALKPTVLDIAMGIGGFGIAGLLLFAGIMLVTRRPVARPLHLVYSVLACVSAVVSVGLTILRLQALKTWATQNPDSDMSKMLPMLQLFMYVGIALGLIVGLAYPIFILIWFGAVKRDTREITEGFDQEPAF